MGAWTVWFSVGVPLLLHLCNPAHLKRQLIVPVRRLPFLASYVSSVMSAHVKWQLLSLVQCLILLASFISFVMLARVKWQFVVPAQWLPFQVCSVRCVMPPHVQ
jgi:hypothetical protein